MRSIWWNTELEKGGGGALFEVVCDDASTWTQRRVGASEKIAPSKADADWPKRTDCCGPRVCARDAVRLQRPSSEKFAPRHASGR